MFQSQRRTVEPLMHPLFAPSQPRISMFENKAPRKINNVADNQRLCSIRICHLILVELNHSLGLVKSWHVFMN